MTRRELSAKVKRLKGPHRETPEEFVKEMTRVFSGVVGIIGCGNDDQEPEKEGTQDGDASKDQSQGAEDEKQNRSG